jgi:RHS repeat-associated protein
VTNQTSRFRVPPSFTHTRRIGWYHASILLFLGLLSAANPPVANAQQDPLESIGIPPFSAQIPVEEGYINPATGDLHIEIPLGTFVQRGGRPVKYSLMYDSGLWSQGTGLGWSGGAGGWRFVSSAAPGFYTDTVTGTAYCPLDHTYGQYISKYFVWTAPDGTTHQFGFETTLGITNKCGTHSGNGFGRGLAVDNSGYRLTIGSPSTVTAPDGTIFGVNPVNPPMAFEDTNGNYFTLDANGNLIDTLGRTPVTVTTNGNTTTYAVLNSQGTTSNYIVTMEAVSYYTDFAAAGSGLQDIQGSFTMIQSIALPDGTSYSFGYDSGTTQGHYGQLTSMKLPTGGQITYSYTTFDDSEWNVYGKHVTRGVSSRTTPDGTWNYTPSVILQCDQGNQANCQQAMTVTAPGPTSDNAVYTFTINGGAFPTEVQYYSGAVSPSNLLATLTQTYDFSQSCPPDVHGVVGQACYVSKTAATTTLPLPGGTSLNQTTKYTWDTSHFGNLMQKSEWNFYTGSLPATADRTTAYTYQTGTSYFTDNILNRPMNITVTDKNGHTVSQTINSYDASITSVTGITHHDDSNYGTGNTTRGNLTQVQRLISGTSNYLTTSKTYDTTGEVLTSNDSNGNQTSYGYADNLFKDSGDSSNPLPFTPPSPTNAYPTTITQGSLVSTFGYYWGKGQKALFKDPNLQTTYYHFYDPLDRPTSTRMPDQGWTYSVYPSGSETEVDTGIGITGTTLTTSCPSSSNICRHDETLLDGLGRVTSKLLVSDPVGQVTVATIYDSNGRILKVSNPYRSTSDSTYGFETPTYDGLNRKIQVLHADGSVSKTYYGAAVSTGGGLSSQLCSSTYGLGYPVLKVDEAGNKLQPWTDGFGRLIEVDEPNSNGTLSVATCYSYDLNNNLTGVAQGTVTRSFSYDLLSRLTSATNPESGVINYYYTTVGGSLCSGDPSAVCRRTDAKSVTTTYAYDTLNRLTSKTYSDSTPTVSYSYDQTTCIGTSPCFNLGRRTAMTDAATIAIGSEKWSYDRLGRMWGDQRTTNGVTKQTTYTYNYDGSLATLKYPSQTIVSYVPNAAEQPISVTDTTNSIVYATNGSYTPNGALMTLSNSTQFNSTFIYNSRLQPCWIYTTAAPNSLAATSGCGATATTGTVLDLKYNFNVGTGDNGNVAGITNNRDATRSQTFTYDPLNRIFTAQTTSTFSTSPANCWGESFHYDQWGNFLSIGVSSSAYNGCTQESLSIAVNGSNQISSPTGYVYDADGNLITVPAPGGASYTYNAENEMTSTAGVTYTYDGNGRRVEKSSGKLYWYGSGGEVLDETDLSGNLTSEYVFFGAKRIARRDSPSNNVFYYFSDHLGTSRKIVQSGQTSSCYEADFYPFGAERAPIANTCPQNYKFTGKERDGESGLDNFVARYDSSSLGRFISPDSPSYSNHNNPQSWNLYAFALNNPVTFRDADGHKVECVGNVEQCRKDAARATRKNVQVQTVQDKPNWLQRLFHMEGTTHNYLTIQGDTGSFAPGSNAARLAGLIADSRTVTVDYTGVKPGTWTENGEVLHGGSDSRTPSQGWAPTAWIDPNRTPGVVYDQDAVDQGVPQSNTAEEFGHEVLGHIWGELLGDAPSGTRANMRDSISAEDAVRALDPTRGQKGLESHHNYNDMPPDSPKPQ